jgi:hypothetical protein
LRLARVPVYGIRSTTISVLVSPAARPVLMCNFSSRSRCLRDRGGDRDEGALLVGQAEP